MDVKRICSLLGVEQRSITSLPGGYHNDAVLLNNQYVLRSGSEFLKHEYELLRDSDLLEAFLYDEQSNTLVTQYVDSKHPESYDEYLVIKITEFLNNLHRNPARGKAADYSWIDRYVASNDLPPDVMKVYAAYKKLPIRDASTIVHTDLALSNILLTDPITVLDWEFWQNSYPEFELAALSFKLLKQPELMDLVFKHYVHPIDMEAYNDAWLHNAMAAIITSDQACTDERVLARQSLSDLKKRRDKLIKLVCSRI